MKAGKVVGLICIGALALTQSLAAKDHPGKGPAKAVEPKTDHSSKDPTLTLNLSDDERRIIRAYVDGYTSPGRGKKAKGLPPGLAKKVARGQELPPGWQKKCVPGEVMPVEVFEKCQPLPPELVIKLPSPPSATVTVSISGQVVRLIKATREILDVFHVHAR